MTIPYPSGKSFDVPEYLQRSGIGITGITLEQSNLIIRYIASKELKGQIKVLVTGIWNADSQQIRNKLTNRGFVSENVDQVIKAVGNIYSGEGADLIASLREKVKRETEAEKLELADDSGIKKKPHIVKHFLQKCHNPHEGNELYEAFLIGGEPYFVTIDRDSEVNEGVVKSRLEAGFQWYNERDNTITKILPKDNLTYISKPYQFESQAEIDIFLNKAQEETLDSLYPKVKKQAKKYIDSSDTHLTIVSADTIFTYFQDNFGQTRYLFFYGDNGSGKTINLLLLSLLGYRAMFDVDITPANIYTYYGAIEEGQGIILEDEVDGLEYKEEKMKLYKKGYNAVGKVTRTETGGDSGRRQDGFYVYGLKAFTGEQKLDADRAKGFNERTFYLECQEGDPEYDLSEIVSPAGDEEYESLLRDLADLHKLLIAYRLIHHTDKIPSIDVQVKNREKQLTKPLLRLFQNSECRSEIGKALAELIAIRRGLKKDTLEAAVFDVVWTLVCQQAKSRDLLYPGTSTTPDKENYDIASRLVCEEIGSALNGTRINDRQQSFETPGHGTVAFKKINTICEDRFGAKKSKRNDGIHLLFDIQRLLKVKAAYDLTQEGIEIIKEHESSKIEYNHNKDRESDSEGSDGCDGAAEDRGSIEENHAHENSQELDTETENFQQNSTIDTRSQEQEVSENAQTEGVYGAAPSQPSLPSPHESKRFVGGSEDWKEAGEEEEDQQ
jgi:hypothetical protein